MSWNISHYKLKTPIFLCCFNKPLLSPLGHERNQCSSPEHQQKWSLLLQMQNWCWLLTRISQNSKVLVFQTAKWELCKDWPFFVLPTGMKKYIYSHPKCWPFYLSNAKPSFFWQLSLLLEGLHLDTEFWHLLALVPTLSGFTVWYFVQPGSSQDAAASQGRLGINY